MNSASKFNRELSEGINALNAARTKRAESAVHLMFQIVGMVLTVGLGVWWLLALLADCGGATC